MNIKERLKGALIGAVVTFSIMYAVPFFARVSQETITVNFNNIRVAVNGTHIQTQHEPFIFEGRTYLPTRDIAEAVGFDVTWEDATNTVHLTSRGNLHVVPDYPPHQPQVTLPATSPPLSLPSSSSLPPSLPSSSSSLPPSPTTTPSETTRPARPSNPAISLERAIEIAEADIERRGINATFRSDSGMDFEKGQWVWELLFRTQGERKPLIEFYINVDNGEIVKFEWDD
jgi:hypothetical protein